MITKRQLQKDLIEESEDNSRSFRAVQRDVQNIVRSIEEQSRLAEDFYALREELATNGVVRDLRKLQDDLESLKTNGVATAINKLNDEVFKERKQNEDSVSTSMIRYYLSNGGVEVTTEQATLAGKVQAILDYLKIDVDVAPEKVKKAKTVAKKVTDKKVSKK